MRTSRDCLFRACGKVSLHLFHLAHTQRQAGSVESSLRKKRRLQLCSDWRLLAWGSWRWASKRGILCDCFGEHNLFFLWLVLDWNWAQNLGSWNYWEHPDHLWPIVAELFVWLPGLVAEEVVDQSSIFAYVLLIVHLFIWSLSKHHTSFCRQGVIIFLLISS